MFSKMFQLAILGAILVTLGHAHKGCDVPESWFPWSDPKWDKQFAPGSLWPNAVVHYTLDPSLSLADLVEVQKAFDAYHAKTCIRFVAKGPSNNDYVNILFDASNPGLCGLATVCRAGGYQFASFGAPCRNVQTIVHELGHSLCYGHEFTRYDRDQYLTWDGHNCDTRPPLYDNYDTLGIMFDYASVMAYQCTFCDGGFPTMDPDIKCSEDAGTLGLSVLDAEKFNIQYDCPGCYSHRFRNRQLLTPGDEAVLIPAGTTVDGGSTYICRTYLGNGDILIGTGDLTTENCEYTLQGQHFIQADWWELLTNPKEAGYRWAPKGAGGTVPANAVAGGRTMMTESVYIGRCEVTMNSGTATVIGRVMENSPGSAWVPVDGEERECQDYEILVCS